MDEELPNCSLRFEAVSTTRLTNSSASSLHRNPRLHRHEGCPAMMYSAQLRVNNIQQLILIQRHEQRRNSVIGLHRGRRSHVGPDLCEHHTDSSEHRPADHGRLRQDCCQALTQFPAKTTKPRPLPGVAGALVSAPKLCIIPMQTPYKGSIDKSPGLFLPAAHP